MTDMIFLIAFFFYNNGRITLYLNYISILFLYKFFIFNKLPFQSYFTLFEYVIFVNIFFLNIYN